MVMNATPPGRSTLPISEAARAMSDGEPKCSIDENETTASKLADGNSSWPCVHEKQLKPLLRIGVWRECGRVSHDARYRLAVGKPALAVNVDTDHAPGVAGQPIEDRLGPRADVEDIRAHETFHLAKEHRAAGELPVLAVGSVGIAARHDVRNQSRATPAATIPA